MSILSQFVLGCFLYFTFVVVTSAWRAFEVSDFIVACFSRRGRAQIRAWWRSRS